MKMKMIVVDLELHLDDGNLGNREELLIDTLSKLPRLSCSGQQQLSSR